MKNPQKISSPGKSLWEYGVTHHVPATVWLLGALLMGVLGVTSMTREALPDLPIPQALVVVEWDGASPEAVEKDIIRPLEEALRGIKGIRRYSSGSTHSLGLVGVQFCENLSLGEAMERLRDGVTRAKSGFPKKAKNPVVEAIRMGDTPIGFFALTGNVPESQLARGAHAMQEHLRNVRGVRKVALEGIARESLQVELYPERLESFGVSPMAVFEQLKAREHNAPFGHFDHPRQGFSMVLQKTPGTLEALGAIPIAYSKNLGEPVRIRDVARIVKVPRKSTVETGLSLEKRPFTKVALLTLYAMPGQDSLKIIEEAREAFTKARERGELIPSINWALVADDGEFISRELSRSFHNVWQSMLIVFLCLTVLLAWREALVAAVGIPLTMAAALGVLWLMGYTLNVLVMAGVILALGMLVDDFILVMEGMHHFMIQKSQPFAKAALNTLGTYGIPSFSGSITTILVMAPLSFMGGVDGTFIRVVPITAGVCLGISYVLSLFVIVPLSQIIMGPPGKSDKAFAPSLADRVTSKFQEWLRVFLENKLLATPLRRGAVVTGVLFFFAGGLGIFSETPSTLYDKEDGKSIGITIKLSKNSSREEVLRIARMGEGLLQTKSYCANVISLVGAPDPLLGGTLTDMLTESTSPRYLGFVCQLTPREKREKEGFVYAEDLRSELHTLFKDEPGLEILVTPEIGGSTPEAPIQIYIYGKNLEVLASLSREVKDFLRNLGEVRNLRDTLGHPETEGRFIPYQRDMEFWGLSEETLEIQLQILGGSLKVGDFWQEGEESSLPLYVHSLWNHDERNHGSSALGPTRWDQLKGLSVISHQGKVVLLHRLGYFEEVRTFSTILHHQGKRCVLIKAHTQGKTPQEVMKKALPYLEKVSQRWPQGYSYALGGEQEQAKETYQNALRAMGIGAFLIYAILALLFRSLVQPLVILGAVIPGMGGVMWGFWLLKVPFTFTAGVGLISLVGINVNDAIVMVDTMNSMRKDGASLERSAFQGVSERLRPVVSTTLTTVLALLPLLEEAAWKPLALAVILGESVSTPLSFALIPSLYILSGKRDILRENTLE